MMFFSAQPLYLVLGLANVQSEKKKKSVVNGKLFKNREQYKVIKIVEVGATGVSS